MKKSKMVAVAMAASLCVGVGWSADWWPFGKKDSRASAPVAVDESPLKPEIKAVTSVAPMLKQASSSVVLIQSAKVRRAPGGRDPRQQQMPWWFRQMPEMPREFRQQGEGSGVIVTSDGFVLTNNHVIEGADEIMVTIGEGGQEYDAEIVGTDPRTDLAVLKIEAKDLPAITLGDSDLVEVGDRAYAIGNPFGVGLTVTSGIVSGTKRSGLRITDYEDFIQTDASINPGNSGGALVDAQGRLIGINTAIFSRSGGNQGIGFAISSNLTRQIMGQLLQSGRVQRGYLGVQIQSLNEDLRETFGVKETGGALVSAVVPDAAADEAGLIAGDVIVEVGKKRIADVDALRNTVARIVPGTEVPVKFVRDGEYQTASVTLKELPDQARQGNAREWRRSAPIEVDPGLLKGVTLAPLTEAAELRVELADKQRGVLVTGVEPDSLAAAAGIMPGEVIVEIDRKEVDDPQEARRIAGEAGNKRLLIRVWRQGTGQYLVLRDR